MARQIIKEWMHTGGFDLRKGCLLAPVWAGLLLQGLLLNSAPLMAQAAPPSPLTLDTALDLAMKNYPAIRAAHAREAAAGAGTRLARTAYLPSVEMLWQSNRATRNNIFGLLLPNAVIPPISGPVLSATSGRSVWGSAAGVLFSWEPLDFGYRRAAVNAARAGETRASAEASVTQFDVAVAAADAFLTLLAAQQNVEAAQADVQRREVFAKSIHVLVTHQLRPGADASRADAEVARAQIALSRAQQAEQVSRATLAEALGIAGTVVSIDPGPLLSAPPKAVPSFPALSTHPLAAAEQAKLDEVRAREHILDRSYYPKLHFQVAASGRGSGAGTDGQTASGLNGLGLERANWVAGITVTFPLMKIFSLRASKGIENSNERAEAARYDQVLQQLTGQLERAEAALEGARRVAEKTPIQLQAARDAESQAGARYQAGLGTVVDVADAQSLLTQAEIDDALARLAVWHNLAAVAAAEGHLEPLMQVVSKSSSGGQ